MSPGVLLQTRRSRSSLRCPRNASIWSRCACTRTRRRQAHYGRSGKRCWLKKRQSGPGCCRTPSHLQTSPAHTAHLLEGSRRRTARRPSPRQRRQQASYAYGHRPITTLGASDRPGPAPLHRDHDRDAKTVAHPGRLAEDAESRTGAHGLFKMLNVWFSSAERKGVETRALAGRLRQKHCQPEFDTRTARVALAALDRDRYSTVRGFSRFLVVTPAQIRKLSLLYSVRLGLVGYLLQASKAPRPPTHTACDR